MDLMALLTGVGSMLGTLSIWEMVKYWMNRKTNKRKEEAEADSAEFQVLRDISTFMQEQLKGEVERYADQTQRLRQTQDENFKLLREIEMLKIALVKKGGEEIDEGNNHED